MYDDLEERFKIVLTDWVNVCDEKVESCGCGYWDEDFSQKHDDCTDSSYNGVSKRVGPDEFEPILGSIAKVFTP